MIRCAYILSFDRNDSFDYVAFHKKLIELPLVLTWSHYLKSSYVLIAKTNYASRLNNELSPLLKGKGYLLMKADLLNVDGFLPKEAWEWFDKQIDKMPVNNLLDGQVRVAKRMVSVLTRNAKSYKIGKTGMSPTERLNQEDYVNEYTNIAPIVKDSSPEVISAVESYLIDYFIRDSKCDNEKSGVRSENDQMKESDSYCVYVVWK